MSVQVEGVILLEDGPYWHTSVESDELTVTLVFYPVKAPYTLTLQEFKSYALRHKGKGFLPYFQLPVKEDPFLSQ